jgi:hypothetical protein
MYGVRNRPTWQMNRVELARVFADHFGYTTSHRSNCIYDPAGKAVAQGWHSFASKLVNLGLIAEGTGINWRRAGHRPRITWQHSDHPGASR